MTEKPKTAADHSVNNDSRQKLLAGASLIAIITSALCIYDFEFRTNAANKELHQAVGLALADETARATGHHGNIVLVTVDARNSPELKWQLEAFEKDLKTIGGLSIKDKVVLDPGENPKFRPGSGLSAKRFLKIARKHPAADAIVSELSEQDLAQVKTSPKLIAEAHSPEKLVDLLTKKILVSAIVPRFEFPAPGPRKPQTSRQWFDHYFQILTPNSILPAVDNSP